MMMEDEKNENKNTKDYLEKSYRLLFEHINKEWEYLAPEEKESELNQREIMATKKGGYRDSKNDRLNSKARRKTDADEAELKRRRGIAMEQIVNRHSGRYGSLADFAVHHEIPIDSLKQMLEVHHERD